MNPAQLTGHGSFTFRLGGERFRGAAVPLAQYFAWSSLTGAPGSPEHVAWYAARLAERHLPGRTPVSIDADWVLDHVHVHQLPALENLLLEEEDPGEALETGREFVHEGVRFRATSYTLREQQAALDLNAQHGERWPHEVLLAEMARALRLRFVKGLPDPALVDVDWVLTRLSMPALLGLQRLLLGGRLPGDPEPEGKAQDPEGKG